MFINESILKGHRRKRPNPQKADQKQKQASATIPIQSKQQPSQKTLHDKTLQLKSDKNICTRQSLPLDQLQFQKIINQNLNDLLKKWQDSISQIQTELHEYDHVSELRSQEQAYLQCMHLLNQQFSKDNDSHNNQMHIIQKKIFQVEDYKLRVKKQLQKLKMENKNIQQEVKGQEKKIDEQNKKKQEKKQTAKQIQQQNFRNKEIEQKIKEYKEQSHEQKSEFIEIQEEQFRLEEQLGLLEEEEDRYNINLQRDIKYKKLLKIKEKIFQAKDEVEDEVMPHLERKINKMARLRADICQIEIALETSLTKIEDQTFIIDALKQKAYTLHMDDEDDQFERYKKKYDEIYLSKNKNKNNNNKLEGSNWNDYKNYLKLLTMRNQKDRQKMRTEGNLDKNIDDINVLDLRPNQIKSKKDTKDKFYKSRITNQNSKSGKVTKLPKLVKTEENKTKKDIKEGIVKNSKDQISDFSLQSIDSDNSHVSGEIIEVQFHQQNKKK